MLFNIPILLTWLRVVLILLMIGVSYIPNVDFSEAQLSLALTVIFIIAALTDWFDGFLARRWRQTSAFGAFLDPVADKLMVTGALIILVHLNKVNPTIAFIIIGREITISALREWMAKIGAPVSIAVHFLGKVKTATQMLAIPMLLYHRSILGMNTFFWGKIFMFIAAFLTVWSMFYYLKKAWPSIKKSS